jgi:hypothetical protein
MVVARTTPALEDGGLRRDGAEDGVELKTEWG